MAAPHDDVGADLPNLVGQLRADLAAAAERESALTMRLAARNNDYDERAAHQAAAAAGRRRARRRARRLASAFRHGWGGRL